MIAAAIVCAAVMGQASSVSWAVDWAYSNDGKGIDTFDDPGVMNYWIVNLGTSTDTSGLSVDASGNLVNKDNYGILETGSLQQNGGGITPDGVVANNNYLALVIYDAENGLYGVSGAELVSGIVDQPPTAGSLAEAFNNDGGLNDEGVPYMVANMATAVPEPTSGLLLLLGVAGLALRRRRA